MDNKINLKEVLDKHLKWIRGEDGGERADLSGADLYGANLSWADLSWADLSWANLSRADLYRADLSGADLYGADLSGADLSGADLSRADLSRADLSGADLSGAYLSGADLSRADLSGADLSRAYLSGAYLSGAKHLDNVKNLFYPICCPEFGSFIGWKKARSVDGFVIVELQITEDAKRCSASSRKCRCSKAVVLSIKSIDGDQDFDRAVSDRDRSFVYEVRKTVSVDDFDENRWHECSTGIHFFITREEAVHHVL